ncbi:hypothetical protein NDU88_004995 [Pleurodeles waltl]|uniref:Uncharacterized protein n=1 Tax=Pleurodeles waltl TaxID=8319 RepID=A0AAV7SKJ2_PLEWA|nr:hypothetical protein NDU88_004995 [Pleurodeles waltl]
MPTSSRRAGQRTGGVRGCSPEALRLQPDEYPQEHQSTGATVGASSCNACPSLNLAQPNLARSQTTPARLVQAQQPRTALVDDRDCATTERRVEVRAEVCACSVFGNSSSEQELNLDIQAH